MAKSYTSCKLETGFEPASDTLPMNSRTTALYIPRLVHGKAVSQSVLANPIIKVERENRVWKPDLKLQRTHFTRVQGTRFKDSDSRFARLQAEGLGVAAVGSEFRGMRIREIYSLLLILLSVVMMLEALAFSFFFLQCWWPSSTSSFGSCASRAQRKPLKS